MTYGLLDNPNAGGLSTIEEVRELWRAFNLNKSHGAHMKITYADGTMVEYPEKKFKRGANNARAAVDKLTETKP